MSRLRNRMIKIAAAGMAVVMIAPNIGVLVTYAADQGKNVVETTDTVNIRAKAGTDAEKLGLASKGEQYILLEQQADGWSRIEYEDGEAYIKSEYLKIVEPEKNETENTDLMLIGPDKTQSKIVTDETAYVTLDYDGNIKKVSIVKACDRNAETKIVDYGKYESVTNMTTLDEAVVTQEGVTWNFNEDDQRRFYYEVVPQDQQLDIPWDISISYSLNGQLCEPEKLAGASGLVGIDVKAVPNPDCLDYYKNNFILMAGMMIDTEDNYSFSAPGAQLQTLGTYQAAFFTAMPKQEQDFHFYIGSDSFETSGLFMMMMPVTMSQMDDMAEINEHKDNLENASSAMNNIMDDMLDMMSSMSTGMTQAADGMDQLDIGSGIIAGYDEAGDVSIQEMLLSLDQMNASLGELSEVMGDTQIVSHIFEMSGELKSGLSSMDDMVDDMDSASKNIGKIQKLTKKLENASPEEQGAIIEELRVEIHNLNTILQSINDTNRKSDIQSIVEDMEKILSELEQMDEQDQQEIINGSEQASTQILKSTIAAMANSLNAAGSKMNDTIDDMGDMVDEMNDMADVIDKLAGDMDPMLAETRPLLESTRTMMKSMSNSIQMMDSMMDEAGPYMENGMHLTLSGMSQLMRQMVETLKKTDDIQQNKDIIVDVIQDEWDRLDDEMGILDIDTSARKISFTSEKNPEPRSLQIVLRTQEIEVDDVESELEMAYDTTELGMWDRIKQIFVKIGTTLTDVFS